MNRDFVELLRAFVEADVRFVVVGAGVTFADTWRGRVQGKFDIDGLT